MLIVHILNIYKQMYFKIFIFIILFPVIYIKQCIFENYIIYMKIYNSLIIHILNI